MRLAVVKDSRYRFQGDSNNLARLQAFNLGSEGKMDDLVGVIVKFDGLEPRLLRSSPWFLLPLWVQCMGYLPPT